MDTKKSRQNNYPKSVIMAEKTKPGSYAATLAQALIYYAHKDGLFAQAFGKMASKRVGSQAFYAPGVLSYFPPAADRIGLLIPSDIDTAMRRARWLLAGIGDEGFPGRREAIAALADWIHDKKFTVPKQLIIGIVGLAIIGPTLGLIKRKVSMVIVVRRDLAGKVNTELAEGVARASHKLLLGAISLAGGDLNKLDPDMADWFFGEKEMNFYAANEREIGRIEKDLKALDISRAGELSDGSTGVLAISPAVNRGYGEIYWNLRSICDPVE